jgi:hypothetical protein
LAIAIFVPLGPNAHAQPAPAAWHPVGNALEYRDAIESFEAKRRATMPWLPTAQRE